MEDNDKMKKHDTCQQSSHFFIKVVLLALSVIAAVQFILMMRGFASLNRKLNALEEEKSLGLTVESEDETRRTKRSVDEKKFNKAMVKLEKLEKR